MSEDFMRARLDRLEDFWGKTAGEVTEQINYQAYGHPVCLMANDPLLLAAGRISANRYSHCQPLADARPITFRFILDHRLPDEPTPPNWPSRLRYTRTGKWLAVNAEPWVNAFADLESWTGVALISPSLAREPQLYSRFVGDCFVLNLLMRSGWGQLHASCLCRGERALLLQATHNVGKSTTAFRLAMNDYRLLSDGMTYVRRLDHGVELHGYPVGEVKLRLDMLDEFRQVKAREAALVREDTKMVYDLRREMPGRMIDEAIRPQRVTLCLLQRTGLPKTVAEPVSGNAVLEALLPESTFLDDMPVLVSNLESIRAMLEMADCYRLLLGTEVSGIIQAVKAIA